MTDAEKLAWEVREHCLQAGVSEFVVCAGSRNSPLVLALCEHPVDPLHRHQPRVWSFFDERSAAFFALGRSRAIGGPVAVVTTSGTAAAELLPAVIEAHYLSVPLLCITADRPRSFRGTGAPQAIEQVGLFGPYVGAEWDAECANEVELDNWTQEGPAHLNVAFEEPLLSGTEVEEWRTTGRSAAREFSGVSEPVPDSPGLELDRSGMLVLLGSLEGQEEDRIEEFLLSAGCPILADATSGFRNSHDIAGLMLKGGEHALKTWTPKRVLRIGGVPSGRFWRDLESLPEVEVFSVFHGGFSGLARESTLLVALDQLALAGAPDLSALEIDHQKAAHLEHVLLDHPDSEPAMIRHLSRWIPRGSLIFLGNSMPIREWNLAAAWEDRDHRVFANRGANGIDGNLSTFLGLAADEEEAWAVVGDLTALYDLSAPWIVNSLNGVRLRIVVINNGGGRIFSRLPVLGELDPARKHITENHHGLRFDHWAAMWGFEHIRVEGNAIPAPGMEHLVMEMVPDEEETRKFFQALNQA